MHYLSLEEIITLHAKVIAHSGGILGLRDRGALESAVAQPEMTFGATISIQLSQTKPPR